MPKRTSNKFYTKGQTLRKKWTSRVADPVKRDRKFIKHIFGKDIQLKEKDVKRLLHLQAISFVGSGGSDAKKKIGVRKLTKEINVRTSKAEREALAMSSTSFRALRNFSTIKNKGDEFHSGTKETVKLNINVTGKKITETYMSVGKSTLKGKKQFKAKSSAAFSTHVTASVVKLPPFDFSKVQRGLVIEKDAQGIHRVVKNPKPIVGKEKWKQLGIMWAGKPMTGLEQHVMYEDPTGTTMNKEKAEILWYLLNDHAIGLNNMLKNIKDSGHENVYDMYDPTSITKVFKHTTTNKTRSALASGRRTKNFFEENFERLFDRAEVYDSLLRSLGAKGFKTTLNRHKKDFDEYNKARDQYFNNVDSMSTATLTGIYEKFAQSGVKLVNYRHVLRREFDTYGAK